LPDDDASFVLDMLSAAREVDSFVRGRRRSDLDDDRVFRLALERSIEVIGVAASRVTSAFRDAHPEVPWHGVIGQRNVIAHQYDRIMPDRLWAVATRDIPQLIALLEPLVPPEE
jgi:uncharacterized protein with HEPN domain